jgi:ribonuclease BN (tRNA processing enzyme)
VTTLELTVLGCAGSHTSAGRVCSGYLVRAGDTKVLIDAGNGATANLQRFHAFQDLDAIVVSHRHVDHCVDLVGAFYAVRFVPGFDGRVPLYAAPEVHGTLTGLLSGDSAMRFDDVFAHQEVTGGDELQIGPMRLVFADSIHPPPTVSTRIEVDGRVITYSGDSAGGEELVRIAQGADLFLCDATWTGDPDDHPPGIHLTARGAAEVANEAGVARLVLTHIAGGTDRAQALAEASEVFDGPVELAEELRSYVLL